MVRLTILVVLWGAPWKGKADKIVRSSLFAFSDYSPAYPVITGEMTMHSLFFVLLIG